MSGKKSQIIALVVLLIVDALLFAFSYNHIACGFLGGLMVNAYMIFFGNKKNDK